MAIAFALAALIAQVSPAPSPAPSALPCQQDPDVMKAVIPEGFGIEEIQTPLSATIAVVLAPDGTIERVSIYQSSGNRAFDLASLSAAKASRYRPKIVNCTPVESTFLFKTSVAPGG